LNGDEEGIRNRRIQTIELFDEAVNFYQQQHFDAAIVLFRQVMAMAPDDLTALLFIEKATQYLYHGVPENWSGTVEMQIK
jgi:hypothetical protein